MQKDSIIKKLFLIYTMIGFGALAQPLEAQDYAKYYYIWDKYLGVWYGKDNTVVSLTQEDGDQIMIYLRYNGKEYDDGLFCFSPSYASAEYLSLKNSSVTANFTAGLTLSAEIPTLRLYYSGNNNPFFETKLSKVPSSSSTSTSQLSADNELVGTKWQHINRNNQLSCILYFYSNNKLRITNFIRYTGGRDAPYSIKEVDNSYSYDQRGKKGQVVSSSGERQTLTYSNGQIIITGSYNDGTPARMVFTRYYD
jgi:hypothetical protein